MKSKFLSGAAALALVACTVVATASPAAAAWGGHRGWHGGWHGGWGGPGAIAAGVIGGALAAATSPLWAPGYYDYEPGYAYGPYYAAPPAVVVQGGGNVGWCEAHYRSYNPATGMFLGYDGQYHPCP
jgi:hypothetical protein